MPWWQSAICLPDDPDKTLVGKDGQLLFDFGRGGVRNFGIALQPETIPAARWVRQQSVSARAPIVQTWKDAGGVEILEEAFVAIPHPDAAATPPARRAVALVTLRNTTQTEAPCQPVLRVQSVGAVQTEAKGVTVGDHTRVSASEPIEVRTATDSKATLLVLPAQTLKPGESRQVAFTIDRNASKPTTPLSASEALRLRDEARQWWEHADLPFETVQVPDPDIQAMLESCVRNIWQAREIKQGLPAFHVGPTVYRGLWVVDGSFLLESAAILNRAKDARAGVEYLLSHQKPDGSFEILPRFWKENGIVLWAATRHAMLTQDKDWLRGHWDQLKAVVAAIHRLREQTRSDPKALDFGLLPSGEVDGGISNRDGTKPEYSNTYWCLAGLKSAIAAARWLGDNASADAWQKEYDDFLATFRKAAARDTLHDSHGNAYVPTMMGNIDHHVPQRGQWAFCHAVYPGGVFALDDPFLTGQMAMLRATKQQGLIYDTGWMREGIWTYFASFYGHATLWQGNGREAAHVLYDFARHAAPLRVCARSKNRSAREPRRSATCRTTGPAPSSSGSAPT